MTKRYFKALTKTQYEVAIRVVSSYGDPGIVCLPYRDIKEAKLRVNQARYEGKEAIILTVKRSVEVY
jgi:hypothetical protein